MVLYAKDIVEKDFISLSPETSALEAAKRMAREGHGFVIVADPRGRDRKSTRLNSSHLVISYAVFCLDRKSTRLNSSHLVISYAVFCLKKKSTRINSNHLSFADAFLCAHTKSAYR